MTDIAMLTGWSEAGLRIVVFLAALILFSVAEAVFPRRKRRHARLHRWRANAGLLVIGTLILRGAAFALPLATVVSVAQYADAMQFGLFHFITLPIWLEFMLVIILLDAAIWLQHLAMHKLPILWRVHQVHHTDTELDASSALRFHPLETVFSAIYKMLIAFLLGPAAAAVILFEILLNMAAMFNHSNLALPHWFDRRLRLFLVTPDMHRVHHSVYRAEHDRNFGFCLSIWDRIFATYKAQPDDGHMAMQIGLGGYQLSPTAKLGWALQLPFGERATRFDG